MHDLGRLDEEAIRLVRSEAWPIVRDADELHDALLVMGALPEADGLPWIGFFKRLVNEGRATLLRRDGLGSLWVAAERLPMLQTLFPQATPDPQLQLPQSIRRDWEPSEARVALVRGRLQASGPVTAGLLSLDLGVDVAAVEAALLALEGEGTAMRGQFTPRTASQSEPASPPEVEWCDRRLLARIHRQTLDGLRRRIQPVEREDFVRFLMRYQRVLPDLRLRGSAGVWEVIDHLQGFEAAAGAWESGLLPSRVRQYAPEQLDELSVRGELVWGRLRTPRKSDDSPSASGITRAAPISLMARECLDWLLPPERDELPPMRGNAELVLAALKQRGALFQHELCAVTRLLPAHLAEALHELAALGLVTADSYGAVRTFVQPPRSRPRRPPPQRSLFDRPRPTRSSAGATAAGRWTLFPGLVEPPSPEMRLNEWAWQLLRRWGVIFRDLLLRETAAPAWSQLVSIYRRLEARGEVRGGRFVAGVGGEQYALPQAVDLLRQVRDEPPQNQWVVVSAADPLNLSGILDEGPRLPATHLNSLALCDGRMVATQQAGEIRFHASLSQEIEVEMVRRLRKVG
jgi:ATP-dependent Lhr-like helicase